MFLTNQQKYYTFDRLMTAEKRNGDVNAHDSLEFLAGSTVRIKVLDELSQPLRKADLAQALPHSKKSIRAALARYEQQGWVRKLNEEYSQTAGGAIVLRIFDEIAERNASDRVVEQNTTEELRDELRRDLNILIKAPQRVRMLRAGSLSTRSSTLSGQYGKESPTAHRDADTLISKGWYEKNGPVYERTAKGETILSGYSDLYQAIKQTIEKESFTYRLTSEHADLPATKLSNAELIDVSRGGPDAGITGLKKIGRNVSGSSIEQIRTVCPVYKPSIADAFSDFISLKTNTNLVYDRPTFRKLCHPRRMPLLCAVAAHPHTEVRIYPEDLTFGVGLYDNQGMVMAYNDVPGNEAGIITADECLTEWMATQFECYWQQSQPLSTGFMETVQRYVDESVWSISDVAFWTDDKDGGSDQDDGLNKHIAQ